MNMITLPVIALKSMTVLPDMVIHFDISRKKSIQAVENALAAQEKVLLLTQKDPQIESPKPENLYKTGTVAVIKQVIKLPGKQVRVQVEGLNRAQAVEITDTKECLLAVAAVDDSYINEPDEVTDKAILIGIKELLKQYGAANSRCNKEMLKYWLGLDNARTLILKVCADFPMEYTDRQALLEMDDIIDVYEYIAGMLIELTNAYKIKEELALKVKARVDNNQKEYIIREQLNQKESENFKFKKCFFGEMNLPKVNLIVANFSLPFSKKEFFSDIWKNITNSLSDERVFCWKFFWKKRYMGRNKRKSNIFNRTRSQSSF